MGRLENNYETYNGIYYTYGGSERRTNITYSTLGDFKAWAEKAGWYCYYSFSSDTNYYASYITPAGVRVSIEADLASPDLASPDSRIRSVLTEGCRT